MDRRPKRKRKSRLAAEKYCEESALQKGRRFQKKLIVLDFMGPNAPRSFAMKELYVWIRGILPEIELSATEEEVRGTIADVINNRDVIIGTKDFEFMEASSKCLCVPAQRTSFQCTGRAVKQLAGAGAVYVRLTVERPDHSSNSESTAILSDSSSSDCLPQVKVIRRGNCNFNSSNPHPPTINFPPSLSFSSSKSRGQLQALSSTQPSLDLQATFPLNFTVQR